MKTPFELEKPEKRMYIHLRRVKRTLDGVYVKTDRYYFPDTNRTMESIVVSSTRIPCSVEEIDNEQ